MSVVKREDGIKFVIHTYRETLLSQRSFKLKEEIRSLAQDHGEYVRFFRKNDEHIEAIFSKEPGFLLAETVWYYFNRPADLIYCEALSDQTHALLVIVQEGSVYLDAKLTITSIEDEIASFMTGDHQYHVYVYGNTPLSDTPEPGKWVFSKEDLAAFTRLQESAFEKLPTDEKLQLQPLNLALRTQNFGKASHMPLIAGMSVLFLLAAGWWYVSSLNARKAHPQQTVIERPFASYENTLSMAQPLDQVFENFSNLLAFSSSLPGWQISNVVYNSNAYLVNVKPQSQLSSLQVLEKWLSQYGLKFTLKKEGAQFVVPSPIEKRQNIPEISEVIPIAMKVVDRLKALLPLGAEIQLENESKMGLIHAIEVKINFSSTSPDVLIWVGRELSSFPVLIKEMNFSADNNLLSGSVELMVLGK